MILLVDDEPADLRLYARLLREAGYSILVAGNGAEALSLVSNYPQIKLILLDIVMPDLSGIATATRIRELPLPLGDVPIVGITGFDPEMHRDAPMLPTARFDAILRKPVGNREILDAVLKWS